MNNQFTVPDEVYMVAEERDTGAGTYVRTLNKYLPEQSGGVVVASYAYSGRLTPSAPTDIAIAEFFPDYANATMWVVERYVNDDRIVRHLNADLVEDATVTYTAAAIDNPNSFSARTVTDDGTLVIGPGPQLVFVSPAGGGVVVADFLLDGSSDRIASLTEPGLDRLVYPLGAGDTVFIERPDNSWYALNSSGQKTPDLDPTGFGGAAIIGFTAIDGTPYFRTRTYDGTFFTEELRDISGEVAYSYTVPVAGESFVSVLYKYGFYAPPDNFVGNLAVVDLTTGSEVFNSTDTPTYDNNVDGGNMTLLTPTTIAARAYVDPGTGLTAGGVFVDLTTGAVARVISDHLPERQTGISKYVVFEDYSGYQVHDAAETVTLTDPPGVFDEGILPVSGRYKVFSAAVAPAPAPPFWTALNKTLEIIE